MQVLGIRLRPYLQALIAIGLSGAICTVVWRRIPSDLHIRTTTVGYVTVLDFNVDRYTDAYLVIAFAFPLIALALYALSGRVWAAVTSKEGPADTNSSPPATVTSPTRSWPFTAFWAVLRVLVPAFTVVIEVAVARGQNRTFGGDSDLAGVAYIVLVLGLAAGMLAFRPKKNQGATRSDVPQFVDAAARVNSLTGLVVLPLLYLVSRHTTVSVASDHHTVAYPWLPWWFITAATLLALVCWGRWARQHPHGQGLESRSLTWVVGPALLLLFVAQLPGALGAFQGFDDSQNLASAQLVFTHGLFPWRNLYPVHGLFDDVLSGGLGMAVFGNTRWGISAGDSVLFFPAYWLSLYFFAAHFSRRNRLVLLGLGVLVVAALLPINSAQFLVVSWSLIFFALALGPVRWWRCGLFALTLFSSMVLVPETTFVMAPLVALVVLFDLGARPPGQALARSFGRSVRCVSALVVLGAAFALLLAATHSVSAFVNFYRDSIADNAIAHGLPVQWSMGTDLLDTAFWLAPVALWLLTCGRIAVLVARRQRLSIRDWTMIGAACIAVLYDLKLVQRADIGHVFETASVAAPLIVLWGIQLVDRLDGWARQLQSAVARRFRRMSWLNAWRAPISALALALVAGLVPLSSTTVNAVPAAFHATSPNPPLKLARVGYSAPGALDINAISALGQVIDRLAGPRAPIVDFTNDPGVVYYLLDRVPGNRFYIISEATTLSVQEQMIGEIEASQPPVVVFSSSTYGVVFDGVSAMVRSYAVSQYLLDHYRPVADVDGQLLLLRNGLPVPPLPHLNPPVTTTGLDFTTPACNFGMAPNFLSVGPSHPGAGITAALTPGPSPGLVRATFPTTDMSSYHWLEISSTTPLGTHAFVVEDAEPSPSTHQIQFDSLPPTGRRIAVEVGSCLQWHAYPASSFYLVGVTPAMHLTVRLTN